MTDIKISGLAELQTLLDELPAKIESNIVRGGLRTAAKVVELEARRLCPIGKTSALRDSIHVSMRAKHGHISATIKAGGAKAFYAHMVEYGTARHWIKPKNRKSLFVAGLMKEAVDHPGAKKEPFMRPAIDGKAADAIQTMADYMRDRIPKEIDKAGKK
ncbi:MAG: HK97 gp10 family phage protein [Betaproteobacteria bacterium]|nr:HK97 gp10 family phage protein [Betaproteobacteria bacterium]